MAGLGILLAGLSSAGKGLSQSIEQDRRVADEERLMRERSRLDEEKQLRIEEARRVATRKAGVLQGQEISVEAGRLQSTRDQTDAERINAENANVIGGSNMTAADAASLRDAPPEARKAYGILGSSRQSQLEDRATAAEGLGYLDAARETRGILQTEIQNQRNQDVDASTNRRLDLQDKRQTSQDEYSRRREDRLDRLASAQLGFQQARASKEDARSEQAAEREQRSATAAALRGAEVDIKSLQKEIADPLMADEQKRVLQQQLDTARADARRFRQALAGAGIEEGKGSSGKSLDISKYIIGGNDSGSSGARTVPNPLAASPTPAPRQSPKEMAVSTLDRAIDKTVRELTAASNRGDKAEAERLNQQLIEQQAAKRKAVD